MGSLDRVLSRRRRLLSQKQAEMCRELSPAVVRVQCDLGSEQREGGVGRGNLDASQRLF